MLISPHTYRRLAYVACWEFQPQAKLPSLLQHKVKEPQPYEVELLHKLLNEYEKLRDFFDLRTMNFKIPKDSSLNKWLTCQRDCKNFSREFNPIKDIADIVRKSLHQNYDSGLRSTLILSFLNKFNSTERAIIPSFRCSLSGFNCFFSLYLDNPEDNFSQYMIAFLDLHHFLYSNDGGFAPSSTEKKRRIHIAEAKSNGKNAQARKSFIKEWLPKIEKLAKSCTSKEACKKILSEHEEEFRRYGIHSSRTLENIFSRRNSKKKADYRRTQRNTVNAKLPICEEWLCKILGIECPK